MDIIFLHDFKVDTLIGVYDWERTQMQTVQLDLDIAITSSNAFKSDDITDTIHYGLVAETIEESLKNQHFLLIEALAEHIAQLVMDEFSTPWIRVKVTKLGILPKVKHVGVMIERGEQPA
ncbi:dihydroneopterin aldolase [Neisseria sp. Ec49-e6-T10]|uniref:dihydroneopterin aldolase n=1 Tax=Neisseria sp. Ec49-e6-T10 TaxID=3140744 RepID=UPI003EBD21C7